MALHPLSQDLEPVSRTMGAIHMGWAAVPVQGTMHTDMILEGEKTGELKGTQADTVKICKTPHR